MNILALVCSLALAPVDSYAPLYHADFNALISARGWPVIGGEYYGGMDYRLWIGDLGIGPESKPTGKVVGLAVNGRDAKTKFFYGEVWLYVGKEVVYIRPDRRGAWWRSIRRELANSHRAAARRDSIARVARLARETKEARLIAKWERENR